MTGPGGRACRRCSGRQRRRSEDGGDEREVRCLVQGRRHARRAVAPATALGGRGAPRARRVRASRRALSVACGRQGARPTARARAMAPRGHCELHRAVTAWPPSRTEGSPPHATPGRANSRPPRPPPPGGRSLARAAGCRTGYAERLVDRHCQRTLLRRHKQADRQARPAALVAVGRSRETHHLAPGREALLPALQRGRLGRKRAASGPWAARRRRAWPGDWQRRTAAPARGSAGASAPRDCAAPGAVAVPRHCRHRVRSGPQEPVSQRDVVGPKPQRPYGCPTPAQGGR